jgi:hypothetical protein
MWEQAIGTASPTMVFAVGTAAARHVRYIQALQAFSTALESPVADIAGDAHANIIVIVRYAVEFRNPATIQQFVDKQQHSKNPKLRLLLAEALLDQATMLRNAKPRLEKDVLDVYQRLVALYGADQDPELRKLTAKALTQQGSLLCELARWQEAAQGLRQHCRTLRRRSRPQARGRRRAEYSGPWTPQVGELTRAREAYQQIIDNYPDQDPLPFVAANDLQRIGDSFVQRVFSTVPGRMSASGPV